MMMRMTNGFCSVSYAFSSFLVIYYFTVRSWRLRRNQEGLYMLGRDVLSIQYGYVDQVIDYVQVMGRD